MADFLITVFNYIGRLICHQIPERTFTANGIALPVCARCTGIYLGAFVSFIYVCVCFKTPRDNDKADLFTVVICAASYLPLAIDGATSLLTLRDSNNLLRLITGVAAGYAIPLFIAFANGKAFITKKGLAVILPICATAAFLVYNTLINYYIIAPILCAGVFLLYFSVINMIIRRVYEHKRSA